MEQFKKDLIELAEKYSKNTEVDETALVGMLQALGRYVLNDASFPKDKVGATAAMCGVGTDTVRQLYKCKKMICDLSDMIWSLQDTSKSETYEEHEDRVEREWRNE